LLPDAPASEAVLISLNVKVSGLLSFNVVTGGDNVGVPLDGFPASDELALTNDATDGPGNAYFEKSELKIFTHKVSIN
jgi:hypothetical protein